MSAYQQLLDNNGIIGIVQRTLNQVDKRLMDHGSRVCYLVYRMLRKDGRYSLSQQRDLCFLAMLHDIGAYKMEEIDKMVQFETGNVWEHSIHSYLFIKHFSSMGACTAALLFHHTDWEQLRKFTKLSPMCRQVAQLINIADRADVFLHTTKRSTRDFAEVLRKRRGTQFAPEIVDLFLETAPAYPIEKQMVEDKEFWGLVADVPFTKEEIEACLRMLIFTIDFRSRHTVTHTLTTTHISINLAERLGYAEEMQRKIACGAMLHDLGKIGIPVEILEFPGKLSPQAMSIMRTHVDLTRQILGESVSEEVREIALRHHEKLDGTGYPIGLSAKDLTLPQRIVAVADIVSALSGTRSYKDAFSKEKTLAILRQNCAAGKLDAHVVDTVILHYDEIMQAVALQCEPVLQIYHTIRNEYNALIQSITLHVPVSVMPAF